MLRSIKAATFVLAAFMIVAPAHSAPIVGTGLPGAAGTPETHWTAFLGDPAGGSALGLTIVNGAADYPGAWVPPAATDAQWITPYATGQLAVDDPLSHNKEVFYTYLLNFDDPNRDINVQWSSDNDASFFLNDVLLSVKGLTGYSSLTAFTILDAVFQASNTFRVVVRNENGGPPDHNPGIPNPTGLRVDVGPSPVPLPPAMLLFGSALLGMNWLRKRRAEKPALINAHI